MDHGFPAPKPVGLGRVGSRRPSSIVHGLKGKRKECVPGFVFPLCPYTLYPIPYTALFYVNLYAEGISSGPIFGHCTEGCLATRTLRFSWEMVYYLG